VASQDGRGDCFIIVGINRPEVEDQVSGVAARQNRLLFSE
jgi:hypothetical protein